MKFFQEEHKIQIQALLQLGSPTGLALVLLGTTLGIFVGAIPGLTGTMLIALMLPLTFGVDPQYAMTLLISIYVGAISGGMITATLLRMPGTPASIITTLDGYPLARKGRPERALALGVALAGLAVALAGLAVALTVLALSPFSLAGDCRHDVCCCWRTSAPARAAARSWGLVSDRAAGAGQCDWSAGTAGA